MCARAYLLFGEPSILLVLVLGLGQEQLGNGQGDPRNHVGLAALLDISQHGQGLCDLLFGKGPRLLSLSSLFFQFLAGLLGLGDLGDSDVELLVEPEGEGLVGIGDLVVDDLVAVESWGEIKEEIEVDVPETLIVYRQVEMQVDPRLTLTTMSMFEGRR